MTQISPNWMLSNRPLLHLLRPCSSPLTASQPATLQLISGVQWLLGQGEACSWFSLPQSNPTAASHPHNPWSTAWSVEVSRERLWETAFYSCFFWGGRLPPDSRSFCLLIRRVENHFLLHHKPLSPECFSSKAQSNSELVQQPQAATSLSTQTDNFLVWTTGEKCKSLHTDASSSV